MNKKSIVFMGTSEFAVSILQALLKGGYNIKMVYTRQDSSGGRGQKVLISAVKKVALDNSLPIRQPASLKNKEEMDFLKELRPDIIIVSAYGLILPSGVLTLPPFGCLNVHPSLLPRYRGPSPISAAILAGEAESGVSIMQMDEGVDTGPALKQVSSPIEQDDTTESLTRKLAEIGGSLLLQTLPDWFEGKIKPTAQSNSQATYSRIIRKEDGEISWQNSSAREIWLKVRAFYPWPGCYTRWKGKLLKILKSEPLNYQEASGRVVELSMPDSLRKKVIGVGTKEGILRLELVQYEGGRVMTAEEFVRGHRDFLSSNLRVFNCLFEGRSPEANI